MVTLANVGEEFSQCRPVACLARYFVLEHTMNLTNRLILTVWVLVSRRYTYVGDSLPSDL